MRGTDGADQAETGDGPRTRLRENATGIASLLVTATWLGAMFTGQEWWLAALLVGYIAVVPLVAILFGDEDDRREWAEEYVHTDETTTESNTETTTTTATESDTRDALETLRERYAAGELTDEQFERKLERLLNTETLEDAQEWGRSGDNGSAQRRNRDLEYDH